VRRRPSRPGLSYLDANRGRLVTIEDDVLGIKNEIQARWPELEVYFDTEQEEWIIVEHCRDHVDRFVLSTKQLDQRILDRLVKADQWRHGNDVLKEIDSLNDAVEREHDRQLEEICVDVAERLRFAFKKDGLYDHLDIYGPRSRSLPTVRNRG